MVRDMLSKVSIKDTNIYKNQKKYSIHDNFSSIEIYISNSKISYRVKGDVYIIAMTKWLQLMLINNEMLKNITVKNLVKIFNLPQVKIRNAIQIYELVEQINEI